MKPGLEVENFSKDRAIYLSLNPDYLSGDNAITRPWRNRMARWYDMSEMDRTTSPTSNPEQLTLLRRDLMEEIEWKDNLSVL